MTKNKEQRTKNKGPYLDQPTSKVVAPAAFTISRDKSGWASSLCELMEKMTIVVLRHLKSAGFARVWSFTTWTSETMIPDSNTVPQAVQTESALGKEFHYHR